MEQKNPTLLQGWKTKLQSLIKPSKAESLNKLLPTGGDIAWFDDMRPPDKLVETLMDWPQLRPIWTKM